MFFGGPAGNRRTSVKLHSEQAKNFEDLRPKPSLTVGSAFLDKKKASTVSGSFEATLQRQRKVSNGRQKVSKYELISEFSVAA